MRDQFRLICVVVSAAVCLSAALCILPAMQAASAQQRNDAKRLDAPVGPSVDPDWPAPYTLLHAPFLDAEHREELLAALPFDRIQLERTRCFGRCPSYRVTFWRDGRAEYEGRADAPRDGVFVGSIDPSTFGRLCFLFEHENFTGLKPSYSTDWTDFPTCYLRVWRKGEDTPIVVEDYACQGPIQLWALQTVVDAVANRLEWKAVGRAK